jgi:oxygen-dependent protoporphyrinogen oxidase
VRVAVVGAGIAGLAAAWELRNEAEVVVFEPGRPGGKIRTTDFLGHPVDEGPDAFITRAPAALALCEELGLAPELVAPAAGRTLLWDRGRLRPLPEGLVLGVPGRLGPVLRSGLLSPAGIARAGLDLVLPRTAVGEDESVGSLVSRRFGSEVATRLVEPLLGSIHAAGIDELSAATTAPQLLAAARRSRSLLRGLRPAAGGAATRPHRAAHRGSGGRSGSAGPPLFLTPRAGLGRMVDVLVDALGEAGTTMVPEAVTAVRALPGAKVELEAGGGAESFDGVVLATPSPVAARLLGDTGPGGLVDIEWTSVTLLTIALRAGEITVPGGVNGVLVPRGEGRLMTACSFGSSKWPQWAAPDQVVLRVSVGRHGDTRADTMDDDMLTGRILEELCEALGATGDPLEVRVSRWPEAFPFYRVGHLARVAEITGELARSSPGVALAGAGYSGAGVPACVASGRSAARALLARRGAAARRPTPDVS